MNFLEISVYVLETKENSRSNVSYVQGNEIKNSYSDQILTILNGRWWVLLFSL